MQIVFLYIDFSPSLLTKRFGKCILSCLPIIFLSKIQKMSCIPAGDAVCPRPNLPDVIYDGDTKWFGSGTILDVTCKKQFVEAYPYITCVDGQWTDPEPPCKSKMIYRRDKLRGENEVGYQHECQARPECRARRVARGLGPTQVLILTCSIPLRLVLLLPYLSALKQGFKYIYLQCLPCQSREEPLDNSVLHVVLLH